MEPTGNKLAHLRISYASDRQQSYGTCRSMEAVPILTICKHAPSQIWPWQISSCTVGTAAAAHGVRHQCEDENLIDTCEEWHRDIVGAHTIFRKCSGGSLLLLLSPAMCTERMMTVRSKSTHFVRGRLVADNSHQNDAYQAPKRVLWCFHNHAITPQPQKLVDYNLHVPLDFIAVWFLRTRKNAPK